MAAPRGISPPIVAVATAAGASEDESCAEASMNVPAVTVRLETRCAACFAHHMCLTQRAAVARALSLSLG
jgi:hypothetical protein